MKAKSFNKLLDSLRTLNSSQYRRLRNDLNAIQIEKVVPVELETKIENLLCPHCQSGHNIRWSKRNDLQRYRCKDCLKTFNSLTKTPLARLRKKSLWLMNSECILAGFSVRKTAKICNVHNNTAFRWRHRFLENLKSIKADHLQGIVEADETYFLRSEKGNKNLTRIPRKRGGKAAKRGLSEEQVCVFISRDRNKNTFDRIFDSFTAKNLTEEFLNIMDKDALFCSDSKSVFKKFVKENNISHGVLNSSKGERVKKGIVHIQNVNSYHSKLKDWMSRFNGVATKYLENYLSWYRGLDEFKEDLIPLTILIRAKFGGKYKKQPLTVT